MFLVPGVVGMGPFDVLLVDFHVTKFVRVGYPGLVDLHVHVLSLG